MNKSNYKRLGDYIRLVDVRNKDLKVTKLLGVSISKTFIQSIANTIGTDMSTYKIVKPMQFAYGPVTSRNGDKVSVALLLEEENAIISQAYTVFEVLDINKLLPQYLMMWFRRPEFDRYARYKSHGSAREIFDWETMCDVEMPIPPIEQQQKIVAEYETLSNRIRINEQTITKLEDTAQALYRKMFVDNIDKENLPEGWRMGTIEDICEVRDGTHDSPKPIDIGFPLVTSAHLQPWNILLQETYNISESDYNKINERSKVDTFDILYSMIGTIGSISYVSKREINFAVKNIAIFKTSQSVVYAEYLLFFLKSDFMKQLLIENLNGSTQNYITLSILRNIPIIIPEINIIDTFKIEGHIICNDIILKVQKIKILKELQSLLLSKMGQ